MVKSNKKRLFYFWLSVALILVVFKYTPLGSSKLDKDYRYTVGEITGAGIDGSGAFSADVRYSVKGIVYSNSFAFNMEDVGKYNVGDKYFIKYYPTEPEIAKVEHDLYVPKSIKIIPPDGWKELPIAKDTSR